MLVDGEPLPLEPGEVEWDTLVWGYVRRWARDDPGPPRRRRPLHDRRE